MQSVHTENIEAVIEQYFAKIELRNELELKTPETQAQKFKETVEYLHNAEPYLPQPKESK